jgi:acyl-CoA synthetase (NDP forming)
VATIPVPVDVAIIASPASTVGEVLHDCGHAGVGVAVVITAGFSEVGNDAGEAELREGARRHGMRLVGPNCAGILNTVHSFCPTLEVIPPRGATALVSQSGALGGAVLSWAEEQGLGFSKFVSYGNGADLNEADFLRYLAEDDDTKVVALYIESVADGRAFMDALECCTRRKPVVVIKAGRTSSGQRAALSHTGSMAGSDSVYDAALRACGAIRVKSVEEMFDLCKGFVSLPAVRGRRIAIVTNSGGPGVLAADQAEEAGLKVTEPGRELRSALSGFLPGYCSLRNPIDLTVEGTESGYRETLKLVLDSGEYDAALALNVNPAYLDSGPLARGVADAIAIANRPVVVNFMAGRAATAALGHFSGRGIPVYPTGERAVAVVARMAQYTEWQMAKSKWRMADSKRRLVNWTETWQPQSGV